MELEAGKSPTIRADGGVCYLSAHEQPPVDVSAPASTAEMSISIQASVTQIAEQGISGVRTELIDSWFSAECLAVMIGSGVISPPVCSTCVYPDFMPEARRY
jgi:hypothetical protein